MLPTVPMKGSVLCGGAPRVFPRKFCAIAAAKQPRHQEEDNSRVCFICFTGFPEELSTRTSPTECKPGR